MRRRIQGVQERESGLARFHAPPFCFSRHTAYFRFDPYGGKRRFI